MTSNPPSAKIEKVIPQFAPTGEEYSEMELLLLQNGVLTENQMGMAKFTCKLDPGLGITDAIARLGFSPEIEVLSVVAKEMGYQSDKILSHLPSVDYSRIVGFSRNLAEGVSEARNQCVFDYSEDEKWVKIILTDPLDPVSRSRTETFYKQEGYKPDFYVTTKLNLALIQKKVYSDTTDYADLFIGQILKKNDTGEGIQGMISLLFEYAALERSSDIYFNYNKYGAEFSYIFFRIDRQKSFKLALPRASADRLAQAIKQRSGIDAGKLRGHDDGAMEVKILEDRYNLNIRINKLSIVSGEQLTMRIQMEEREDLDDLGFETGHVSKIKEVVRSLRGIVLLAGVTGSGKTTTLYSMLNELDADAYNIITMEDPVEIRMNGVNQVEINDDAKQSFAETIRAALRQAPDVVLLGEIRDAETAAKAVEMSLTGHLVLTTLHTDSIENIPNRLKDLGVRNIDPFIKSLKVAAHQELVPKNGGGLALQYEIAFNGIKNVEKVSAKNQ